MTCESMHSPSSRWSEGFSATVRRADTPTIGGRTRRDRLSRYAANRKRDIGATAAGALFWSDSNGEQIPYLRGYLSA